MMDYTLTALIFIAAILYAAVGHGGGSGYLAAMAFCNVAPTQMKPIALILNVLVASIGFFQYYRAGFFSKRLLIGFSIGSVPCAYLGGQLALPDKTYKIIVGICLLYAAIRLISRPKILSNEQIKTPSFPIMMSIGAGIGFLSGLTGVGGGIFLSPIVLLAGWCETRKLSGVSAGFILVNSIAALAGFANKLPELPTALPYWLVAAGVGGWMGANYGANQLNVNVLQKILGIVLIIAGLKMIIV